VEESEILESGKEAVPRTASKEAEDYQGMNMRWMTLS